MCLKNKNACLQNAYLPTMPEDILQEVRQAGGTFYGESVNLKDYMYFMYLPPRLFAECPNGHPYLVGEVSAFLSIYFLCPFGQL